MRNLSWAWACGIGTVVAGAMFACGGDDTRGPDGGSPETSGGGGAGSSGSNSSGVGSSGAGGASSGVGSSGAGGASSGVGSSGGSSSSGVSGIDSGVVARDASADARADATADGHADAAADAGLDAHPDATVDASPTDAAILEPVVWDGSGLLNAWWDGGAPRLSANVTIHIAGDSTACIFPPTDPTMRIGWGQVFQQFWGPGVTIDDEAQSGRSSKSFIDEGFWATLKAKIVPGDYVFIEFGHNDEKSDDPTLFTDPASTYQQYLQVYVTETRAAGGFPVLLTPISRRQFSGTTVEQTHGAYPAAMINLADLTSTPVIDMTARTTIWLTALGPVNSVPLFAVGDNTHLSALGAPEVGALVVQGIEALGLPLVARLKE